jgi:uncharacterized protein (DUF983 family)
MRLASILRLRCPVCGKGRIFNGYFDTPERCPHCAYFFMRENGYFLPHVPIGYFATVLAALGSWPVLYFLAGVRSTAITLTVMVGVALVFGIWFLRYAKMIWLVVDLYLHPPVKEDFEERGRQSV